jgi:ABC-type Fe3+-hydroxamate transport system substrate-binding protein
MKICHALAAICAAAVLALTACTSAGSSDSSDAPAATTVIETTDPAPAADDMTQTIVDLSWDQQTEADKDAMCTGIAAFGNDWAAEQMQAGAGDNTGIDWDQAAQLVEAKCAQR